LIVYQAQVTSVVFLLALRLIGLLFFFIFTFIWLFSFANHDNNNDDNEE
jgi:hypothetical protein